MKFGCFFFFFIKRLGENFVVVFVFSKLKIIWIIGRLGDFFKVKVFRGGF